MQAHNSLRKQKRKGDQYRRQSISDSDNLNRRSTSVRERRMRKSFSSALILAIASLSFADKQDCITGPSRSYAGTRSTTESGITCQRWDASEPHAVKQVPQDGGHHNYCRNPDDDSKGTWCYTTDPSTRWEYCSIPKCDEPIQVVWTSHNSEDNSASFQFVKADPELMTQERAAGEDKSNGKVFGNSHFRALDVERNGKKIFYIDDVNNYLGVFNTKTLEVTRFLEGEASNIYAISQDFLTGNIYYTNTETKSVMVTDKKFRARVSIHQSEPYEPRAIAVLHGQGKVVFSTYAKVNTKIRGAQIMMADMSGQNLKVLMKSPDVVDVTGIAVDNERIYWTDNLGYGSKVMSCLFDGSDKKEHFFKRFGCFEDIAVYTDYIYVTDSKKRYNYFDHIRYNIEVITKDADRVFIYTKPDQPRGIAILRKMDGSELKTGAGLQQCQKNCGGVCLPDVRGVHRCRCTFGYRLRKSSGKCAPVFVKLADKKAKH